MAGAARQTPFFTSGAASGTTCTARCDGARLIHADCTSVDCAVTGPSSANSAGWPEVTTHYLRSKAPQNAEAPAPKGGQ